MEYPLLIFTILNLALAATHAALPPELYWKSVLPTTPMPKAIANILRSGKGRSTKWKPMGVADRPSAVNYGPPPKYVDDAGQRNYHVDDAGQRNYHVDDAGQRNYVDDAGQRNYHVGDAGQRNYHVDDAGQRNYVDDAGQRNYHVGDAGQRNYHVGDAGQRNYDVGDAGQRNYVDDAGTETLLNNDPSVAGYFLEKDLHSGAKFNLQFTTKSSSNAAFSPRQVANSIPFSSHKVQDIFNEFSIQPGSLEAQVIQNTIKECEAPAGIRGEEKYCATSLESMVDFCTSKLGKNVEVVSTEVGKETKLQEYTIAPGVKKISGDKAVVCHKQDYPYAVFYCHKIENTSAFNVPLEGSDGARVKAVAVCHTDTSQWNPKHFAFRVLKVKPGTPVCHFLPEDTVVWVPK